MAVKLDLEQLWASRLHHGVGWLVHRLQQGLHRSGNGGSIKTIFLRLVDPSAETINLVEYLSTSPQLQSVKVHNHLQNNRGKLFTLVSEGIAMYLWDEANASMAGRVAMKHAFEYWSCGRRELEVAIWILNRNDDQ